MKCADDLVAKFIEEVERKDKDCFVVEGVNLKKSIANYLWEIIFFNNNKFTFSEKYENLSERAIFIGGLWKKYLSPFLPDNRSLNIFKEPQIETIRNKYVEYLGHLKESVVFYCKSNRSFNFISPITKELGHKVAILTLDEIDETLVVNNNVQVIELALLNSNKSLSAGYIKEKFYLHYLLLFTFYVFVSAIRPRCVIFVEGCHFDAVVLSSVCSKFSIPTICLQQGWPGLMHTRFMDMEFDYFLTWGREFNKLWRQYNKSCHFIQTGYLNEPAPQNDKSGITFFLQAPLFTIDDKLLETFLNFIIFCAAAFPDTNIYVREHPEYKIRKEELYKFDSFSNISLVTNTPISEVYSKTQIGVSIFSSTLAEGLIHDTIPFVFNLSSNPSYYPDLKKEGIGIEVKTYEDAIHEMKKLVENKTYRNQFLTKISKKKHEYFGSSGTQARANLITFLGKLINR